MPRNVEGSGHVTTEKWYSAMQRAILRAVVKLRQGSIIECACIHPRLGMQPQRCFASISSHSASLSSRKPLSGPPRHITEELNLQPPVSPNSESRLLFPCGALNLLSSITVMCLRDKLLRSSLSIL